MSQATEIEKLRSKYPGLAAKAATNPRAAIKLFCVTCMGGDVGAAIACDSTECPLHAFRPTSRPGSAALIAAAKARPLPSGFSADVSGEE